MTTPAPPPWQMIKGTAITCPADVDVTVGSPGPLSKAGLFCDLPSGHESLHYDSEDHIWWRPGDVESADED